MASGRTYRMGLSCVEAMLRDAASPISLSGLRMFASNDERKNVRVNCGEFVDQQDTARFGSGTGRRRPRLFGPECSWKSPNRQHVQTVALLTGTVRVASASSAKLESTTPALFYYPN